MRRVSMFTIAAATAAAVVAGMSVPTTGQAQGNVTAFEGARIIVGDGSPAIEKGTIVVTGQNITAVGANVQVPAGAQRVNLAGKTVMPMIIDTHIHAPDNVAENVRDMKRRAYWGVSAAMSMGTETKDTSLKQRSQDVPGQARILSAGRGITGIEKGREQAAYWVGTVAEARKVVQENAAKRPDIIKIWVDDRDHTVPKLTPELYGAIIDEAHKANVRVTAHIFNLDDGKGLLKANVDAFAHSVRDKDVDDEFMALMKSHPNVVVNPNLPGRGVKSDTSWLQGKLPADEYADVEKGNVDNGKQAAAFGIQSRNLKKLSDANVPVVLGTDGNQPWAPHQEMESMAVSGMTPMQVIVASTSRAATFLRLNNQGAIQAGKSADLLVLDANPLDNITNTRRINAVYHKGQMVNRGAYPN
jgi:imidazolonepropionase-like amidohydrolase